MEALDVDFFQPELSERSVSLLPDGTTCYAATYFASKEQYCYATVLFAITPPLMVMTSLGGQGLRTASLVVFFGCLGFLLAWHALRYRRYLGEVRAGCHMQGIFLFVATRDVVVRFHRPLGGDVEASLSRDTVVAVTVRRSCCRDCLVIDRSGTGAPSRILIPSSWLVDAPATIAAEIETFLGVSHHHFADL